MRKKNKIIYYYNPKTRHIINEAGFIVYSTYTEKDFKNAIKTFKAKKLRCEEAENEN